MDVKRIEIIFLVAFCSLNVYLAFLLYSSEGSASVDSSASQSVETIFLKAGIEYANEISDEKLDGYYLSSEQTNLAEDDRLSQLYYQSFDIQDSLFVSEFTSNNQPQIKAESLEEGLDDFIGDAHNVQYGEDYEYLDYDEKNSQIIYSQVWKDIVFMDDTAEVKFNVVKADDDDYNVVGYEQQHITNIEELRDKQEVISERDALNTLYLNSRIPDNSKIIDTQLAYVKIFTVRDNNVYVPAWIVHIETSSGNIETERVNGMTNTLINSVVSEVNK